MSLEYFFTKNDLFVAEIWPFSQKCLQVRNEMEREGQKGDFWPLLCKFLKTCSPKQESGKMGFGMRS